MKIILSIAVALATGVGIGHYLGALDKSSTLLAEQEKQFTGKSQNAIHNSPQADSTYSQTKVEKELSAHGFTSDGVFGKLAEQINRYQQMSDADFEAEIAYLSTLSNSDRYISSYLLFTAWGEKNPEAALAYLERDEVMRDSSKSHSKRVIYKAWTAQNPDSVIANLTDTTDLQAGGRTVRYDLATITNEWYKRDKEAAFDWIKNLDSEYKDRAISGIFSSLAEENMSEAKQKLNELEGSDYNEALEEIAERWGESMDWNNITAEIAALPEEAQELARREALERFSRNNPYEATEIISGLEGVSGEQKYRFIRDVAGRIGTDNPSGTLDWALSNIQGKYQSRVTDSVFNPWAKSTPNEAAKWLLTQPDDQASKRMYNYIVKNSTASDSLKQNLKERFETSAKN